MSRTLPGRKADPCGSATGNITTSEVTARFDPLIERTRATWTAGDFGRIASGYARGAAAFVDRLSIAPGETVLDVACGTGNLSIPAARRRAKVKGIDIAPNLIDAARKASVESSLEISFDVGAAEALPYADNTFDTVISMFGVMFSARPEQALSELLRVTRPGGRIALANWPPNGFIGTMLRAHTAAVPPPAGAVSSLAWGDEATMRQRLEPFGACVRDLTFVQNTITFVYPLTPAGVVDLFREFYGPSVRTFGALDADGRAALTAELLRLWDGRNTARDGSTRVDAEYVEVRIDVA